MGQIASPYQIGGSLNFQPGGNPFAGAGGGLPGLATNYGLSYNSALQANQQSYNNILNGYQQNMGNLQTGLSNVGAGYGNLMGGIQNTLGANYGVPGVNGAWGVAAPAMSAIQKLYSAQTGQQFDAQGNPSGTPTGGSIAQQLINSGLGKSTALNDANRGAFADYGNAVGSLGANLAQTYAGYQANIGEAYLGQQNQANLALANEGDKQLNWMNSIQIPYPNASLYAQLYQQQGQAAQAAAQMQLQQQLATGRIGGGGSSGGGAQTRGGVSIQQMPRGGTYGSGGGSYPSGGAGSQMGGPSVGHPQSPQIAGDPYINWAQSAPGAMSVGTGVAGGAADAISQAIAGAGSAAGSAIGAGLDYANGSYGDMAGDFGFSGMDIYA